MCVLDYNIEIVDFIQKFTILITKLITEKVKLIKKIKLEKVEK